MWARIDDAKKELAMLAENWTWSSTKLKLGGIGTPKLIIDNIMETASYTPYVPTGSIRKNKKQLSNDIDFELLLAEAKNIDDITLFDEEQQRVFEIAGKLKNLLSEA